MARLSDKDWRSVLDLSGAAADLPVHQRLAFLQSAAASPEIAREVLELLAADNADESSEPVSFASPGMRIGRFVIEGCLGRGGMGEVYSARDTDLGRKVALKFLREGTIGSRGSEQNFIREAKTASALNHPNIVTIHELIRQESVFAIVMEWVEGIPLRRFCENPCSSQQTIDIGRQIALALAAAHGVGVVHRDIKPENILVRPDGHVKVLDFGLARRFQGNEVRSVASMPAGTLRYMSPEQARNQPVTAASDLFSFGLVLYELASGRHPFSRPSPLETAHAILTADPEELPASLGIPAPLRDLIGSLLSKDPAARPTAAEAARQLVKDPPPPKNGDRRGELWARYRLPAMVLGAILGAVAIAALLTPDIRGREDFRSLKVQPLTSQSGWESAPAISPDGQSIAFTWSEKLDRPRQIYLKRPNDKDPVKLTNSETGNILYLVWSPDGSRIAFKRQFEKAGAIYTISSAGTDEQKIVDLTNANLSSSVDWSPDGSQLAFADDLPGMDRMALYLYTLQTGEKRKLTSPPAG